MNIDSNLKTLQRVAKILRKPNTSDEELQSCLQDYQNLMIGLISLDKSADENKLNLKSNTGIAIAPTFAADCLTDFIRTKVFVNGLFEAIEQLKQEGKEQVHIFYAGTGPYATLLLPVLASYPSSFIQCSLLEINEISIALVQEVFQKLGFENYVKEFIHADATNYSIKPNSKIDILLSETMSLGLKHEQQVPILMNLVPQLKDPFLLIPQNIKLTLAFMKNLMHHPITKDSLEEEYCQRLGVLLETSIAHINSFKQASNSTADWKFPQQQGTISLADIRTFHNLVVLTEIQVFESNQINIFESDLTRTVSLLEFENLKTEQVFTIRYKVDEDPGYFFELKAV